MKKIKCGEDVEGYAILVLNEREVRATAGILKSGKSSDFYLVSNRIIDKNRSTPSVGGFFALKDPKPTYFEPKRE